MTFSDTIPAWLSENPTVPTCPAWCIEPDGHRNPTAVFGDWARFHVAYRKHLAIAAGGEVTLEVAAYQSLEGNELTDGPAQLTFTDGKDLTPVETSRMLGMLCESEYVLARISGVQS